MYSRTFRVASLTCRRVMTRNDFPSVTARHFSASPNSELYNSTRLGQTSVFYQTGLKICELPMVVKKVEDVLKLGEIGPLSENTSDVAASTGMVTLTYPQDMDPETSEILSGFSRCITTGAIFRLLETIPAEEVTPPVAVHVLKKIIYLKNFTKDEENTSSKPWHGHLEPPHPAATGSYGSAKFGSGESFMSFAFVNMLLDIILKSRQPKFLIEGLQIVSQLQSNGSAEQMNAYGQKFFDAILDGITEGGFSLVEICNAIQVLSKVYADDKKHCHEMVDKLWFGLVDKSKNINVDNIAQVFATLPHFKQCRDVILKMLETKVGLFWRHYSTRDVLDMLSTMTAIQFGCLKTLQVTSQWLSLNIQNLSEEEILAVVCCFSNLEYVDDNFIKTLEKYIKVRGCNIKERDLVGAICDYCFDFRIRSQPILEGAGEYFIEHGLSLNTPQIYSISRLYGTFDFHPPNGFKFWKILEHALEHKFIEFPPKEVINLLLSFLYIERYPLNFVRKIFNPFFMDRLHSCDDRVVSFCRNQLRVFDAAMSRECPQYPGPFLPAPKNPPTSLQTNPRIHRLAQQLIEPFSNIVNNVKRVHTHVILSSLPYHVLFVVDIMIYPSAAASLLGFNSNNRQNVAILLHPPEHYDSSGHYLIGAQVFRRRILANLGFRVMEFNMEKLSKLQMHPRKLQEVLAEEYKKVMSEV